MSGCSSHPDSLISLRSMDRTYEAALTDAAQLVKLLDFDTSAVRRGGITSRSRLRGSHTWLHSHSFGLGDLSLSLSLASG